MGSRHLVVVKVPNVHGMRFLRRNAVTVRVELPEGSDVTVVTASADIEVTGLIGRADVKTSSGDISTDDVAADVHAKTASGHITVGNVGGEIRGATRPRAICAARAWRATQYSRRRQVTSSSAPRAAASR